jgi:Helix-turn-helix
MTSMTCADREFSAPTGALGRSDEPIASKNDAPKTDAERCAIAVSSGLGRYALVFNDDDAVYLLRIAVESEGNQTALAKRYGVDRSEINAILNGKRKVSGAIAKALGLRKIFVAE